MIQLTSFSIQSLRTSISLETCSTCSISCSEAWRLGRNSLYRLLIISHTSSWWIENADNNLSAVSEIHKNTLTVNHIYHYNPCIILIRLDQKHEKRKKVWFHVLITGAVYWFYYGSVPKRNHICRNISLSGRDGQKCPSMSCHWVSSYPQPQKKRSSCVRHSADHTTTKGLFRVVLDAET